MDGLLDDRMLLLFWVPVLCREFLTRFIVVFRADLWAPVSLLWAFHNGLRLIFQTVKTVLPAIRTPLRT